VIPFPLVCLSWFALRPSAGSPSLRHADAATPWAGVLLLSRVDSAMLCQPVILSPQVTVQRPAKQLLRVRRPRQVSEPPRW
jgi:hypothetical protein